MSYEEITKDNRLSYEAMEVLLRLVSIYKVLNLDTYVLNEELITIKKRIHANLKAL